MATSANWGKLVSFVAGLRKPALIPFGYFSPNDNISFIAGVGSSAPTPYFPTQAPGGIVASATNTFTFTFSPGAIVYNGTTLFPPTDFTVSGVTVTMPLVVEAGAKLYGLP